MGPNLPQVHTYRVFAGPKTDEALSPYGAAGLASYRKSSYIPGASYIARYVITPTLSFTYQVTDGLPLSSATTAATGESRSSC